MADRVTDELEGGDLVPLRPCNALLQEQETHELAEQPLKRRRLHSFEDFNDSLELDDDRLELEEVVLCKTSCQREAALEPEPELQDKDAELSKDAPEGHVAHQNVRFCDHAQGALWHFRFAGQHFQVTVGKACQSSEHAARIARLCYLRFEAGDPKSTVIEYREGLLRHLATQWRAGKLQVDRYLPAPKANKVAKDPKLPKVAKVQAADAWSELLPPVSEAKKKPAEEGKKVQSWASQLGKKFSKAKLKHDPTADIFC
eukprot:TRINITY_DN80987_c0_g1_i1.p1 TRINITY_DN80987_c0_g1~~TRINITY_DN80987_c0_g1_i1.p1  ORF type:complete len:258 (+),score=58.57 TRINITY_DN80987_c0_g1_i1:149-922(+)